MILGTGETDMPIVTVPDTVELDALTEIVTHELGETSSFAGFLTMTQVIEQDPRAKITVLPLVIQGKDAERVHSLLFQHPEAFENAPIDLTVAA